MGSKPAAHTQAVEAVEIVVMPAGQAEHAGSPVTVLNVPTAHASHTDSVFRKYPGSHAQSKTDVEPVEDV